jgi:outer membrane protein assembly complex protein YaeT
MSEASANRSPSRLRRARTVLAFAGLGVALVVGIALIALHTPPARRFIQGQVVALLRQQNVDISADELNFNLFELTVRVRNLRVRSSEAPDLPPFAIVDQVELDLSLTALLRGRYVVESGQAEGVRVHYVVDAQGRHNLPQPRRDRDRPRKQLDYLVEDLHVRDAAMRYEHRANDIDLTLPISSIDVEGNPLTDRHQLRLQAADGRLALQERRLTIDAFSATGSVGDDDATIEKLSLSGEGTRAEASGTISRFDDPVADVTVEGSLDAARAATVARVQEPIAGAVEFQADIEGPLRALQVSGRVRGSQLRFRELADMRLDASATYDMVERALRISVLELQAPFGEVRGSGALALNDAGQSQVAATIARLEAAPLARAFDAPALVATTVNGRVRARWPGLRYLVASGDAAITLSPPAGGSPPGAVVVGGRITARGEGGTIDATLADIRAAGADVHGRIRIADRQRLGGQLRLEVGDVARAVTAVETILGRRAGTLLPAPVSGSLQGTVALGGTINDPRVRATVTAPSLTVGTASDLALDGTLDYSPASVAVSNLQVQWQQATLVGGGTIGLQGRRPLDLSVRGDALQVDELLRALNQTQVPASGTVALAARVGGTVSRPAATFTINGNDLRAYQERWGTLVAIGELVGRQLRFTSVDLEKPQPGGNGRLRAEGAYDLDTRQYRFDLQSDSLRLTELTLPGNRQLRGQFTVTGRGQGSVDRPAGTLRLAADEIQLEQHVLGELRVDAVVAGERVAIEAAAPTFGMTATARIGIEAPYPADATVRITDLALQRLPVTFETPLEGRLTATVEAAGPLAAPREGTATARVASFEGAWNGQPFRVEAPAMLRYASERLAVERLRLIAQDSSVTLAGELPLTSSGSAGAITLEASANLATLAQYAPAGTPITASGELSLTGVIRGTLRAIDPMLTLAVTDGAVSTPALQPGITSLQLRAEVENGEARVEELTGRLGEGVISAEARASLAILPALPVELPRAAGSTTATARVDGLSLSGVPGVPEGVSGRISLEAQVSAERPALDALNGQIRFGELQLGFNQLTLAQELPSTIAIDGGIARIGSLALTGSVGSIRAEGSVGLAGDRPLAVNVEGAINVGVLAVVTDAVRAEGNTTIDVAARGTLADPELNGTVALDGATFIVDEPTIAAENVVARLDLAGRRINVASLSGTLNGGTLTGTGFMELGDGGIADAALDVTADDVANDFPLDLRSLSDVTLRLTRRGDGFVLDGQVMVEEAGLTGDINFDEGLLAAITARPRLDLTEQRNPFLERLTFNVNVDTATPIVVDNNLVRAEVIANLRVLGTRYEPGLAGRLSVLEGGEITLNERRYEVERGDVNFIGERDIIPSFDMRLNTVVRNYDVTVEVTGTPEDTETNLTSTPALAEPDLMALLVTGRTLEEMRGEEFEVAQEQVFSYLAGRVGSQLGRGLERATGLSTVRIEPQLIANETDPSARLTVGREITRGLEVIYSVDLTNSNDQIWVAEYDISRRFQTRAVRQSDNSYRLDFRHDVRFGGRPAPERLPRQQLPIGAIDIRTTRGVSEAEVRRLFDVEPGEPFDFFAVRKAADDVREALVDQDRLQARVRMTRARRANDVDLTLDVTAGPTVDLVFDGISPPEKIVREARRQWQRGVFDAQRIDDVEEVVRGWLMDEQYLQAKVSAAVVDTAPDRRVVRIQVEPGARFPTVVLAFAGVAGIDASELDAILDQQDLERELFTDPVQVTELLERYYNEEGYLVAAVDEPRYEFEGTLARVVLEVTEGPRFVVRNVTTSGNRVLSSETLLADLPVRPGDPFLPFAAENALQHLRSLYWSRGYNEMRPNYELALDREAGRVDVRFVVAEGAQSVVAGLEVKGNDETSDRLVREQLELVPGRPLDLKELARSRSNLYSTGAFSLVDITREELPADSSGAEPVQLDVAVREVQPFQMSYGASFDTERGPGGIFELANHNSLGKARVIGMRSRYDAQVRELRGYFVQPSLVYWPIQTTVNLYLREEARPAGDLTRRYDIDRRGVSVQQERRLADSFVWSYGFRYERARSFDPVQPGGLDERVTVTPLNATLSRETRDEVLDATTGTFQSQAFEYSPSWLGANQSYVKYFGQYFRYFPLQPPRRERLTNEILRPRLVFATGVRVGLAHGFGSTLPVSERFFAGGSTTIRGFEQNVLGAVGPDQLPLGGNAMFVLNNELRMPLVSIFDGVAFSDIGNVFPRVSDFSLTDLRKTVGVGLRARTRWFLLRTDYGFVLDRRPGEPRGRLYFSVGQAF